MERQTVSSRQNPLVKFVCGLADKKRRAQSGLFRFDGVKLFLEAVQCGAPVEYVLLSESAQEKYAPEVEKSGISARACVLSDDAFSKLTDESAPEGIITVCAELKNIAKTDDFCSLADSVKGKTVLMLESVRDVGNMGTIIRSAKAFGIDCLVISADCADLYNPKTVRGAMGALFTQNIAIVDTIPEVVSAIRENGSRVFAAALERDARRLGSFTLERGDAILIGNEGHGLSSEAISACNECLYIPMEEGSESLNAGIAASVCMWELYKTK